VAIGASKPPVVAEDDPRPGWSLGGGVAASVRRPWRRGFRRKRVLCYRRDGGIGGSLAAVAGGWCCVVFAVLRSPSTGKRCVVACQFPWLPGWAVTLDYTIHFFLGVVCMRL